MLMRNMFKKHLCSVLLGLVAVGSFQAPSFAKQLDLLHGVTFEISGYSEAKNLPAKFSSADEIMSAVNASSNLLVHMEVLRRGSADLGASEKDRLVNLLHKRYLSSENDAVKFFDNGYAQLVYKDNKSGLFFLRKANDKLNNQFSNLAYALAQADVDLNIENAPTDVMNFRKLDVTYKLSDAVAYDAKSHQPGFWPAFLQVIKNLTPIGPYASFTNSDFSSSYVPFGADLALADAGTVQISKVESTAVSPTATTKVTPEEVTCTAAASYADPAQLNWAKHFRSTTLHLGGGKEEKVHFFTTDTPNKYKVVAIDSNKRVLADFISPIAPYIVEDINGDGVDELVIRQYLENPNEPIKVYRYSRCGYQLDKTVSTYFE